MPTYFYKFKYLICRSKKSDYISLTFGNVPNEYNEKFFDLSKGQDFNCTFFLDEDFVFKYRDIVSRMLTDSHLVGVYSC